MTAGLMTAIHCAFDFTNATRRDLAAQVGLAGNTVGRLFGLSDAHPPRDLAILLTLARALDLRLDVVEPDEPELRRAADPLPQVIGDLRARFRESGRQLVFLHRQTRVEYRALHRFLDADGDLARLHELAAILHVAAVLGITVSLVPVPAAR